MNSMKAFILQQEVPDLKTALARAEASLHQSSPSSSSSLSGHAGAGGGCCTCPHLIEFLPDALNLDFCRIITTTGNSSSSSSNNNSGNNSSSKSSSSSQPASKKAKQQKLQQFRLMHPVHAMHLWSQLDWIPQQQPLKANIMEQQDHTTTNIRGGGFGGGGGCIPVLMSEGATSSTTTLTASAATTLAVGQPLVYGDEQERMMAAQTPGLVEHWHPWLAELEKDPDKSDLEDDDDDESDDEEDDAVNMDIAKNDEPEANESNRKRKRESPPTPTTAPPALTNTSATKSSFSVSLPAPLTSLSSAASSSNKTAATSTSASSSSIVNDKNSSKSAQGGGTLAVAGRKLPISKTAASQRKLPFSSSLSSLSGSNNNKPTAKSGGSSSNAAAAKSSEVTVTESTTTTTTTTVAVESASSTATETTKSSSLSLSDAASKLVAEGNHTTTAASTAAQTSIVPKSSSSATASTDQVASSSSLADNSASSLPNIDEDKETTPLDKPTETTTIISSSSSMNVDDDKKEEASGAAATATAAKVTSSSSTLSATNEEGTTTSTTTSVAKASGATTAATAAAATTTPTPSSAPSTTTKSSSTSPAKATTTTTTTKTLKSPPTKRKNKYLLSESQFRRYQSSEDSMCMLRRSLLAKRITVIPASSSSGAAGITTASSGAGGAAGNNKNSQASAKKKATAGNTTARNKKGKDGGASIASSSNSTVATTTNSTKTMHLKDMSHLIKPQPIPTIVVSNDNDVQNNTKLGYDNATTIIMTAKEHRQEEKAYITKMQNATRRVELWMHYYRFSQGAYYDRCRRRKQQRQAAAFASIRQYQKPIHPMSSFFGAPASAAAVDGGGGGGAQQQESFCCHACHRSVTNIFDDDDEGDHDDNLMQCLECNFVGCYHDGPTPTSEMGDDALPNGRHMQQHMALSNHCFAVTCGRAARIYCFKCGEGDNNTIKWASHVVFEQEKERIQLAEKLPFMAWKEHPVQRSFDPLQFMRVSPPDQGIIWKGMVATYPLIVPAKHLQAARRCRYRQILFDGGPIEDLLFFWNKTNANSIVQQQQQLVARDVLAFQQRRKSAARRGDDWWWKIRHPVGMFNLGSTCFQSAVFQCLVHCSPLQKYFLRDVGHHHAACSVYNASVKSSIQLRATDKSPKSSKSSGVDASLAAKLAAKKNKHSCLASELDKLILDYYGSSIGMNVTAALRACDNITDDSFMESPGPRKKTPAAVIGSMLGINNNTSRTLPTAASSAVAAVQQGDPLITADILAETWKCTEMAGYAQKDAHEFLHAFLDILGKHAQRYREQVYQCIHSVDSSRGTFNVNSKNAETPGSSPDANIIKTLFEGTLRSVLLCQECGNKRTQSEQFLSISLPLSKEFQKATTAGKPGESSMGHVGTTKLSVERCLRHFTLPEILADSVDCPSCGKKTPTKKQHVVSKLPRVLCLHLKRFDALLNKKIEDHVSFPVHNFNMGSFLPHWCEVTSVPTSDERSSSSSSLQQESNIGIGGGRSGQGEQQQQHQAPPPQLLYNLFGTVNHFGNMQSGHYVANVNVDGSWYHCNDAHVSQTTEADVIKSHAYLLFYIRQ